MEVLRVALTDPQEAGISEGIVEEEEELGQPGDPLEIAKEDAHYSGRIVDGRPTPKGPVINLRAEQVNHSQGEIYLQAETRERLSRLAYLMSCSYPEVIRRLATLEYTRGLLGTLPQEVTQARTIRVRATLTPETKTALARVAAQCQLGRAKNTAAKALDAILDGRVEPVGYATLEEAAEALRRDPLEGAKSPDAEGRILLHISSTAASGLETIMDAFDQRKNWKKRRFRDVVEALANLPLTYRLVGEILPLRRSQRPFVLPMWTIAKLGQIGLDNLLISRPANRRPSALVSETIEYIGQGAIQLIHKRRGLDSLRALREARHS